MPPKTRNEKLYGAACLKVQLERTRGPSEIYRATLGDLQLEDSDVEAYLAEHRPRVEAALDTVNTRNQGKP